MRYLIYSLFVIGVAACSGGQGGSTAGGGSGSNHALSVISQPAGGLPSVAFTTQPMLEVRDASGAVDTSDNTTVITAGIAFNTGTSGAALAGTTTATATAGIVTFTNLSIDLAGTGYRLAFSATGFSSIESTGFNVGSTGGSLITPSTPPTSQVYFSVHSQQGVKSISRYIYGLNAHDFTSRPYNLTFGRSGGNRMTAYNWETNASNAGEDWFNQNDSFLGGGTTPGGAVTPGINSAQSNGAGILITVPMIGYVAADKNGGGDVNQTTNYLSTRFHLSTAAKGSSFLLAPNTSDGAVYQDEFVNFISQTYPGSAQHATTPIFYSLDNEPDLWKSTHPRLRGDATGSSGNGVTYAEIAQLSKTYADAITDVESNAVIFGPVNYGWQGLVDLQNASDAGGRDFVEFYLSEMAAAETTYGKRLLDVYDFHWYPEAGANDSSSQWTRITSDNTDQLVIEARKQAPRSLWDPTYTEDSWIAQYSTLGPIQLLPRMQGKIAAKYPGTGIGITEYYYGGGDHISGGIAQADVLGIYGRESVYAANLWRMGSGNHTFIWGGFDMFRNYDGANGSFGNTSIQATNTDIQQTSVYASMDAGQPGRIVIVCINKSNSAVTTGIDVIHTQAFNTAEVYTLTSGNSQPQRQTDISITLTNAFQYTMPANSVTTLVLIP